VAAAKGYRVFYPNYRGSTGRGTEFAMAGQGDAGGAEFDDVIDGVDHLIAEGLADRDRVGITGGSYGGYFSAWAATRHTERFRAAVMGVGISNHVSKAGTTDIPNEMELVHWRTTLERSPELYVERSPVKFAAQAKTPLLILHGKGDQRVDPGQSMEMYRALQRNGKVPVRLVYYPRDGHGNRNAASRYDWHLRMLRWFDHFLMGDGKDLPPHALDYGKDDAAGGADKGDAKQ
jgi:dipeptidyl aminopeptidase/acylaminoacyl peptidase